MTGHQTRAFYTKLRKVAAQVAATQPNFQNGAEFSRLVRLLLARLANSDWTPLDRYICYCPAIWQDLMQGPTCMPASSEYAVFKLLCK